jgi:hypothetical protein
MQAFCCDVTLAFTKLGIAIAASKPMMATTIINSTNVKPPFADTRIRMLAKKQLQCRAQIWQSAQFKKR